MPTEKELIQERIRKLEKIRALGIDPYPYRFEPKNFAVELNEKYSGISAEHTKDRAVVAGRIVGLRRMGKATFCHIKDSTGKLQLYFALDRLGKEKYDFLKLLDIGDWIGADGIVFKTKTGEVTVDVLAFELLCKSLRPLPEKWHGLQDTELRYRQRYLDLIMNDDVKDVFLKRSQILSAIREFFEKKGFIEVETPVLQPVYGGAAARPFTTRHNELDMMLYLRISLELYHKRLIVGGFDRIFEIGHVFRNEGIDRSHNPEFTLLECYQAYADYNDMMKLTEDLYRFVAKRVLGSTKINYQGTEIDLGRPWKKITMTGAIKQYGNVDVEKMSDDELKKLATNYALQIEGDLTRWKIIDAFFKKVVEPNLVQPTFVLHHPKESTPLCKPCRGHPEFVERFEPFINGWEVGNAYSELNDPLLQRKLLEEQAKELRAGIAEANPMDEDFVCAIEHGMPPTGGLGLGIDRMVMLFTNQPCIRDVIFFPTMKPKGK